VQQDMKTPFKLNLDMSTIRLRVAELLFTSKKRLRVYHKIARLLDSGVPVQTIIARLRDRSLASNDKVLGEVLTVTHKRLESGMIISDALAGFIPAGERVMIRSSVDAGHPQEGFQNCVRFIIASKKMKSEVFDAVSYPVFLIIVSIGTLYALCMNVIPNLQGMMGKGPTVQSGLFQLADFVNSGFGFVPLAVIAVLVVGLVYSLSRWSGYSRVYVDNIPPYSIYRLYHGASWLLSLSSMLSSGMTIMQAMSNMEEDLSDGRNEWLQVRIAATMTGLREENIGIALQKAGYKFPDSEVIDDLILLSALPGFHKELLRMGEAWLEEAIERIKITAGFFKVFAFGLLGAVIMWFATSFMEIYQGIAAGM